MKTTVTLFAALLASSAPLLSQNLQVALPFGHGDRVTGGVFLSSHLLATCSEDATLIVWDTDTGFPVRRIFLDDVAISMRQTAAAPVLEVSCGNVRRGTSLARVDIRTGEVTPLEGEVEVRESAADPVIADELALPVEASFTALSGDRILVGYDDGRVEVWSRKGERPVRLLRLESQIQPTSGVAASGDRVATWISWREEGIGTSGLRFWKPSTLEVVSAETGLSTSVASGLFLDGGTYFVSSEIRHAGGPWGLVLRETETGQIVSRSENRSKLPCVLNEVPGTDRFVEVQYGLTGPGVTIWEYAEGAIRRVREFPGVEANQAVLDPTRDALYSASFVVEEEGLFSIHDAANGESRGIFGQGVPGMYGTAVGMRLSKKHDLLLLSSFHRASGFCAVVDLAGRRARVLDTPAIHSAFPLGDGGRLLVGATEGAIRVSVVDSTSGTPLSSWEYPQNNYFREQLTAAAGWTLKKDAVALSGDEGTAYVVEPTGAVRILRLAAGDRLVDGGMLLPLTDDDWAVVLPDGTYASTPGGATKLAFSLGERAYPFELFDLDYNRPDRVAEAFGAGVETVENLRQAYVERARQYAGDGTASKLRTPFLGGPEIRNREALGSTTDGQILRIETSSTAGSARTASYSVVVNGVPRPPVPAVGGGSPTVIEVPLARGTNRIELASVFSDGTSSLPGFLRLYREAPERPDLYLLAVGVSDYQLDELDLGAAAKDARDISELFTAQAGAAFGEVHVRTIVDGEVTRENILAQAGFLKEATAEDAAVVFLAGHGMLEAGTFRYFFGTTDIDPREVGKRGLAYEDLQRIVTECSAGQRLIVLDTCFAGEVETFDLADAAGTSRALPPGVTARAFALTEAPQRRHDSMAQLRRELFADLRRTTGANVITASGGMEFVFAEENEEVGNGLFTHCVLKGIRSGEGDGDGDGEVTVSELYTFVRGSLRELSAGNQVPTLREVNRYSDQSVARCRSYPKFDAMRLLAKWVQTSTGYEQETEYAELFAPACDYFGGRRSRREIAELQAIASQRHDMREVEIASPPEVTTVADGVVEARVRILRYLVNSTESPEALSGRFGARERLEETLLFRFEYLDRAWLVSTVQVLGSKSAPNPHYKAPQG